MSKGKLLKWGLPVVAALVAVVVFGYLKFFAWNPERQKLARINTHKITVAQFGRELAKYPSPYQEMLKEDPRQLLEQLVLKEVLLQEARRLGLRSEASKGEDPEVTQVHALLQKEVLDKVKVTPEEVEALYKEHKDQLGKKPMTELSPLIEAAIRDAKGKEKMEEYITSLKRQAKVEIDEQRLQAMAAPVPKTNTGEEFKQALKSGKPVLVDFGANTCMPCRQIRPILQEISREYNGKAQVLIIDVYQYKDLAQEYRVQAIPTLIFFDKTGKEVFRHMGAWDKSSIEGKLKDAGAV